MLPRLASRGVCLGTRVWKDRLTEVPKVGAQPLMAEREALVVFLCVWAVEPSFELC